MRRRTVITNTWAPVLAGVLVAACAGGFADDNSVTRIITVPPGMRCALQGKGFNQTVQTPVGVVLPKEAAPITVTCSGKGHRTFVTTLRPEFNGQILGNILAVSVLGMVVDIANGHQLKYPRRVQINMEPTVFEGVEARDRWFNRYRAHLVEKWSNVVVGIRNNCTGQDAESSDCQAKMKAAEADRARELGLLERRRREASVGHVDTAQQPPPVTE